MTALNHTGPGGLQELCRKYGISKSLKKDETGGIVPAQRNDLTKLCMALATHQDKMMIKEKGSTQESRMQSDADEVLKYADLLHEKCPAYYAPRPKKTEVKSQYCFCVLHLLNILLLSILLAQQATPIHNQSIAPTGTLLNSNEDEMIIDKSAFIQTSTAPFNSTELMDVDKSLTHSLVSSLSAAAPPAFLSSLSATVPFTPTFTLPATPSLQMQHTSQTQGRQQRQGASCKANILFAKQTVKSLTIHDRITLKFKQGDIFCLPEIDFENFEVLRKHIAEYYLSHKEEQFCAEFTNPATGKHLCMTATENELCHCRISAQKAGTVVDK
ncbi:hypothetical protein VNI00_017707 [Paramarasmius palmivorus]|uniref:Uncharacterized protein n=1 Tax=Paramarasmius palmivorus TaxID=297713 RepID=A0AAW0B4Z9_9AGAR